ncbi:hypothetical protein BJ741DRAFT_610330 [Chytriomyces cf. hyalinus JEL632]|nr:hypothetical protein BJ741DRAFT_610330 [Chytriomyces cf. hyalinus JEL632]
MALFKGVLAEFGWAALGASALELEGDDDGVSSLKEILDPFATMPGASTPVAQGCVCRLNVAMSVTPDKGSSRGSNFTVLALLD